VGLTSEEEFWLAHQLLLILEGRIPF